MARQQQLPQITLMWPDSFNVPQITLMCKTGGTAGVALLLKFRVCLSCIGLVASSKLASCRIMKVSV